MSKEDRKNFLDRMREGVSQSNSISKDWTQLVQNGTIKKVMDREKEFKSSGGYSELNPTDNNIER